ncbi:MAG: hemerythrin domain-containing protein [Myxococcales bacterium]|nr:hemerythrin domain-containing protein [Myxococcales bacterium]
MTDVDPIVSLEHDHVHLSKLVAEVRRLLVGEPVDPEQLQGALTALRDDLFDHFGREEESLFPTCGRWCPSSRRPSPSSSRPTTRSAAGSRACSPRSTGEARGPPRCSRASTPSTAITPAASRSSCAASARASTLRSARRWPRCCAKAEGLSITGWT